MVDRKFILLLILTSALLVVWPMPGTIALRYALLGMSIFLIIFFRGFRDVGVPRLPLILVSTLTVWICVVISCWAVDATLSWKEFWAQWMVPVVSGFIGLTFSARACSMGEYAKRLLVACIFYSFFILVALHNLLDVAYWISTGIAPFRQAPVLYIPNLLQHLTNIEDFISVFDGNNGEKFSYVNNIFAAFVFAELIQRVLQRTPWIYVSNSVLLLALLSSLLCSYWLSFRNGNIGLVAMLIMSGVMLLVRVRHQIGLKTASIYILIGSFILTILLAVFWKSDSRWERFYETVPIAWDTAHHRTWISSKIEPYPLLRGGMQVDGSAYDRIAWVKEGAILALENPFGTGLNRTAFFDGIDRKFSLGGLVRGGHSHSGVIDFTISNGFPGIFLWIGFLSSIAWVGWKTFQSGNISSGLILMFIVSGFMTRSLIDSNIRDHVLQQFFFLASVFLVLAKDADSARNAS